MNTTTKAVSKLDREHLFYCVFTAIIVSLITGAFKMGVLAFSIFAIVASGFLYVSWLVYSLLSRILRFIYRTYIRGYLSGIKKGIKDIEDAE